MPVNYNFKRGVHLASWHWLNQTRVATAAGYSNAYDGSRYIYVIASGNAAIERYDTWTNQWQFMVSLTVATGVDLEYDPVRNVLWVVEGSNATVWRFFNLNGVAVTLLGQVAQPFTLSAAIAPALPAAATTGACFCMLDDTLTPAPFDVAGRTVGVIGAGATATSLVDTTAEFQAGVIGLYVRFLTGPLAGQQRIITGITNATTLAVAAFGAVPGAGDTFQIELPGAVTPLAAVAGSATTTVVTGESWPVNQWRDADVVMVTGPAAGQRRRIASNTATTLTLAAATAGNPRTGPFTAAPAAGDTFRILPSTDFAYLHVGTTSWYRVDLAATAAVWTTFATLPAALGGGSNSIPGPNWAPFSILIARGSSTVTIWRYDVGPQTFSVLPAAWGAETLVPGSSIARAANRTRLVIQIGASSRMYLLNVVTGMLEPFTAPPYAAPTVAEGKRLRWIRTPDGVDWVYWQRAGGQEFFRVAVEWI